MNEKDIQDLLYRRWFGNSVLAIPCVQALGWEADFLIVTRSLRVHEFEIKTSRSDFLRDKEKAKWADFQAFAEGLREREIPSMFGGSYPVKVSQPPNYFWYVAPRTLISEKEIPPWVGLLAFDLPGLVIQKARSIHRERISEKTLVSLAKAINYRWWSQRLNGKEPAP